jgi:DNA invertase Pin-like site-specific DNA recombinase
MEDASRRNFDCDLVWKYDRFARSVSILVAALQQFSTLGIYFISHTNASIRRLPWAVFSIT